MPLSDHPLRATLNNELHARPFPVIRAPAQVAYLALTPSENQTAELQELIAHLGVHGDISDWYYKGRAELVSLRWERHTEFVTYTIFVEGEEATAMDNSAWDLFPQSWLDRVGGQVLTQCKVAVYPPSAKRDVEQLVVTEFAKHFQSESLASAYVLDENAVIASDFKADRDGFIRFGLLPVGSTGSHRLGRITQRLLEIETYRAMAMLTLPIAKHVFARLTELDRQLAELVKAIAEREKSHEEALERLMALSSEIEFLNAEHAYRFAGGEAYAALVAQRTQVLRETRFQGRQTFAEFMMRRFNPTVRTCGAAQARLRDISDRAARAVDLLGTRVNVRTAAQNKDLLEQMDRRAELQLRLQETVEGLSVVAISYYAVNLLSYFAYPLAQHLGLEKTKLTAILVVPVILVVFAMVRRVKHHVAKPK
ncbi:hypothetical protein GCM10007939_20540 [Amylibacter marinus]|uniref:Membrane-anchored protein n=1 Tax=Amylibacter marinus TaxID=1475483 RepID=A0ABQ5VXI0_9RHOB|nr:DUF3422 domain-containing protein [Amylibacter marinus]GLQ35771.1 hypothetical protein GCM10007939_20540 [Amylibacter marinus]